jgi:hypothetical protein
MNFAKSAIDEVEDTEIDENSYYNVPCSTELQDYMYQMGDKYGFPGEILMVLIYRESGGLYNTNGVISKTNDYGLAQINEYNLSYVQKTLGFSKDEILNDPYKCIEAAALLVRDIFKANHFDSNNFDYATVYGCYNGWLTWQKKEASREYSEGCMEIMNENFNEENKTLTR